MNRLIRHINECEYISFDIFDTLITRNLKKPSDLFTIVEKVYNEKYNVILSNFKDERIKAEELARLESKYEEINYDDIYVNLENVYNHEVAVRLKKIEEDLEVDICSINNVGIDIYNLCRSKNKKIIIITDMYLSEEIIERILKKNNIEYYKLFVSSKYKLTKASGNLFKFVLNALNIKPSNILHIGDNNNSDYKKPKALGMKSFMLKNKNNLNYENNKDVRQKDMLDYSILKKFINNNLEELKTKDYFFNLGYESFGPLLYAYSCWLKEKIKTENINDVFFLSRDGYEMQKAFNIINDDININSQYLYASRRAVLVPTIWMYSKYEDIITNMNFPRTLTINNLMEKFGLDVNNEEVLSKITKYNIDINENVNIDCVNPIKSDKLNNFFDLFKEEIIKNSKEEYDSMIYYYNNKKFCGKVAIVDIGWSGNMQNAICKFVKMAKLDVNILGYYVGVSPNSKHQLKNNMSGFLYQKGKNEELNKRKEFFNAVFETFFLAPHGSVRRYNKTRENKIELYPYEYSSKEMINNINKLQEGALQFVKDLKNSSINKYIKINEYISIYNLSEFGNRPTTKDVNEFKNIDFYDDRYYKMISSKSLGYYIIHINKFKIDFKNSIWKTAFLKKVFKLNIDYYNLMLSLRKSDILKSFTEKWI